MRGLLAHKVAVVTGGGRGIGLAISQRLAQMGASLGICGRTESTLALAAKQIRDAGGECEPIVTDVTSPESVDAMRRLVAARWDRCDILVNDAGVGFMGKALHETSIEQFDRTIATNLRGPWLCMRALLPMMIAGGGGDVINISSIAGRNPLPGGAAYAASKWGLNGLSYSAAEELRGSNVRVCVISPGSTHSSFGSLEGRNPAKMLQPENIAELVALLVTQPPSMFVSDLVVRPAMKP